MDILRTQGGGNKGGVAVVEEGEAISSGGSEMQVQGGGSLREGWA